MVFFCCLFSYSLVVFFAVYLTSVLITCFPFCFQFLFAHLDLIHPGGTLGGAHGPHELPGG